MKQNQMNFAIPLKFSGSKWDNNELRYLLRSLEKNLQFNFRVLIYGDKQPEWLTNVMFKHHPRKYPPQILKKNKGVKSYEHYYDTLYKLKRMAHELAEFVYIYDDNLLLKPINRDFFNLIIAEDYSQSDTEGKWNKTQLMCEDLLEQTCFNYETHLPRKFIGFKLADLMKRFDFEEMKTPYAPSTLYYNFYHVPDIVLSEGNKIKCSNTIGKDKVWMSYQDDHLQALKQQIQEMFPNKSRFEK